MRFGSCALIAAIAFAPATAALAAHRSAAPGETFLDYIRDHATKADRPTVVDVRGVGGHLVTVNGIQAVIGVTAVVKTTLPDTAQATFVATRLCRVALAGKQALGLTHISRVVVRSRTGTTKSAGGPKAGCRRTP